MIQITPDQEKAFDRAIKANAMEDIENVFRTELRRVSERYEQAKEALVLGGDRTASLQLRGQRTALAEVVEVFARQRV